MLLPRPHDSRQFTGRSEVKTSNAFLRSSVVSTPAVAVSPYEESTTVAPCLAPCRRFRVLCVGLTSGEASRMCWTTLDSHRCIKICSRVCCCTSGSPSLMPARSTFRRAVALTVVDSGSDGACLAAGCSLFRRWTLHDMMAECWSAIPSQSAPEIKMLPCWRVRVRVWVRYIADPHRS